MLTGDHATFLERHQVLPFSVILEGAQSRMSSYARERWNNGNADFRRDDATVPPQAVYLPYLVADADMTTKLKGRGCVAGGSQSSEQRQTADRNAVDAFCREWPFDISARRRAGARRKTVGGGPRSGQDHTPRS